MNILELCLSPSLGGLELYTFRCSQALSNSHTVISVITHEGKLAERFACLPSSSVKNLSHRRSYLPWFNARRLAKIIDENNIDILHMHWGNDLALAALAKKQSSRKPALVYTRQMKITRMKDDLYHRYLYREMDLMLTITRTLEQDTKRFVPYCANRITTLYYGVAAPHELPDADTITAQRAPYGFSSTDFVVGLFGRLEDSKGQHLLLRAVAAAKNKGITMKALLVGHEMTPGYRESLKQLSATLQIGDRVAFSDFVPVPQQLMQLCDCVVMASHEETFGLVLPEAMRAGIAVVGSKAGGVTEIIRHGDTGLLFEPRNAESLFMQLSRLYHEPDLRSRLAAAGEAYADAVFNDKKHFEALLQYFETLNSNELSVAQIS